MICFLLSVGLTSCNDWLDVKPETEETLDEIFSKQQGYQDVLIGSYLNLKSEALYGEHLTFGNIEYLAQHWTYETETSGEQLSRFNYKSKYAENAFSRIFGEMYHTIAELNMMLQNIDHSGAHFEKGIYEIIKGEALAMRAYCHFDLLRIFGPIPSNVSGKSILPYVKEAHIDYHQHLPYTEYVTLLEQDLLEAEKLLKEYDPIVNTEQLSGLSVSATNFLKDRKRRLNYYAIKALEARFYLWLGGEDNKAKACTCAKEVISAKNTYGDMLYKLGSMQDITDANYSFPSEHIFSIYDFKLFSKAKMNFTGAVVYKKDKSLIKTDFFKAGTTDIRQMLWNEEIADNQSRSYTITKYIQPESEANNLIPMIRLSEMYFIVMECGTLDEANKLYEDFCIQRDIKPITITNNEQLNDMLIEEYNKEFYGEGQMFYTYKRMNVSEMKWAMDLGNEDSYVVPLPRKEVSYN